MNYCSLTSPVCGNMDQGGHGGPVAPSFPDLLDSFLVVPVSSVIRSKVFEELVKPEVDFPELLPEFPLAVLAMLFKPCHTFSSSFTRTTAQPPGMNGLRISPRAHQANHIVEVLD